MATYSQWNRQLISYAIEGLPKGTAVYLNTDDDAITVVGGMLGDVVPGDPVDDLLMAVRGKVVVGQRSMELDGAGGPPRRGTIDLSAVRGDHADGLPKGVAFLSVMSLAAARMADDEEVSGHNYFRRLCELLQVEDRRPRPSGLEGSPEEALWLRWNAFLERSDLVPTGTRGEARYDKFINYPLSQVLLRTTDRERLTRLFAGHAWRSPLDQETLVHLLTREPHRLPRHVRDGLSHQDLDRRAGIADAIHELHSIWRLSPETTHTGHGPGKPVSTLGCGLRRSEDPVWGDVTYWLYPRAARRRRVSEVTVDVEGVLHTLGIERAGWMQPSIPATVGQLTDGADLAITDPSDLERVALPARDFWVLVPDPDAPDAGALGTWSRPALGSRFVVLCRGSVVDQLAALRRERVLEYGSVNPLPGYPGWSEVVECMVVSSEWERVFVESRELVDALRPVSTVGISLDGGLRDGVGSWIEGYGPTLTVFGFELSAHVTITDASGDVRFDEHVEPNIPLGHDWPDAGMFTVEAKATSGTASRQVLIRGWEHLSARRGKHRQYREVGGARISGAVITHSEGASE